MEIEVYVCPTPGCGNYYGAKGMPVLEDHHTGPKTEDRHQIPAADSRVGVMGMRHNRAECPDCRIRGTYVQRQRVTVAVEVPTAALA